MSTLPPDYARLTSPPDELGEISPDNEVGQDHMSPTRKVSSRLAQREKSKLTKQIFFFGVLSVVMIVAFIFVILPGLARVLNVVFGDSTTGLGQSDTIPPQIPSISSPPSATPSGTLAISGFAEPKSTVKLVLNGSEDEEVTTEDDGTFEMKVSLTEGENILRFFSIDEAGNESAASRDYEIALDSLAPTLELIDLEDGQSFELRKNQLLTIRGTTEPSAKVYINERLAIANTEGTFNTTFQLQEGDNQINFRIVDQAGNETQESITVSFRL